MSMGQRHVSCCSRTVMRKNRGVYSRLACLATLVGSAVDEGCQLALHHHQVKEAVFCNGH
jgi:hypothetical protein